MIDDSHLPVDQPDSPDGSAVAALDHPPILLADPYINPEEIEDVAVILRTGEIGPRSQPVKDFEKLFPQKLSNCIDNKGIATSSGSTGLLVLLKALGVEHGDKVIVPDLTFAATAAAVKMAGGIPIPVDVDQDNWCMNPNEAVKAAWDCRAVGIINVRLFGRTNDWSDNRFPDDLWLIEDMAQALDQEIHPWADGGVYSFFPNKTITTGNGGMIVTADPQLGEACYLWTHHGMPVRDHHTLGYYHIEYGLNFGMSGMQAALGQAQLDRLDEIIDRRKEVVSWYEEMLPKEADGRGLWLYAINCPGAQRTAAELTQRKIGARTCFPLISTLQYVQTKPQPTAANLFSSILMLPLHCQLSRDDISKITEAVLETSSLGLTPDK